METRSSIFEFTDYEFLPSEKKAVFYYATDLGSGEKLTWQETITLPEIPNTQNIPAALLEKTLQSLHLILGLSYYKYHFASTFHQSYALTEGEATFFNTVYKKGLGEFMYRNNLDPADIAKFKAQSTKSEKISNFKFHPPAGEAGISNSTKRYLVGIGGGKDSIVAAELLKQSKQDITAFVVETGKSYPIVENVINILGAPALKIQRTLDPKVHEKYPYNGHIPISAVYAFLGYFAALLYGYENIVVGNEHSSNFGNITYKGLEINHQWSKSFEFEKLFNEYAAAVLTPHIKYFSLLRSFYEIRIVKLFAKLGKKYFKQFSSCNRNFSSAGSEKLWCGECAKCVFAFTLLSAFLPKKELLAIFGQDLYKRVDLMPMFKDILGLGTMKPFDCVGTFEEAQTAFAMAGQKFLPVKKYPEVFQTAKENLIPDDLKFLGAEKALILGYGKEGKITKQFLKKYYPKLKVGVADSALDKNYLEHQTEYDVAIKTPGIHKDKVTIPYTTATNLFFSHVKDKYTTIGITGSKGKTTTTSLIAAILKKGGKKVQLLGNIGTPMLGALLKPVAKDTVFVLELSSYQLDDIHYSPDIAVITNLFPEHMDFHGSVENYYAAKKNIFRFQAADDHLVYLQKAKEHFETSLLGEHNQNNIEAAVQVARILQVPEETIRQAVKECKGIEHRLENIGTYKGITFYNDAISTTPESTIEALKALPQTTTILLGGQDRGYNFSALENTIKHSNIKNVVLFPDSGKKILKDTANFTTLETKSMKEAVVFAYQHTPPGSICLLSCASPSYSVWKNFEQKGAEFKKYVKQLSKKS